VKQAQPPESSVFRCGACDFTLHFSASNASAAFVERDDGRVLFVVRAREPSKGRLAPPGGFIDIGETAEEGVRREVREEVGLELTELAFLCSALNSYQYREVTYPVLDLFFTARAMPGDSAVAAEEVAALCWFKSDEVDPEQLAFTSMLEAWRQWLAAKGG
jgi:ADP-ribose pyrophosphatase YjhB (NUDIX family)